MDSMRFLYVHRDYLLGIILVLNYLSLRVQPALDLHSDFRESQVISLNSTNAIDCLLSGLYTLQ